MFDDFLKFLRSLRKEKKTGITATDQAEKKLQEAADQFTKKTDLGEVTGKFDETTKPGEFKKSKEKIEWVNLVMTLYVNSFLIMVLITPCRFQSLKTCVLTKDKALMTYWNDKESYKE